ncbi:MAG: GtrA family protein [Saccharofermentanales bacterium]
MDLTDNSNMKHVCAIVPAFNPDHKFLDVVRSLADSGFGRILIVNDGSDAGCAGYFDQAAQLPGCTVIRHHRNLGKGRALKTAFNYYLNHCPELRGAVTVDADNQHHIDDVVRCSVSMLENPGTLILGVRNFLTDNVPLKSRMGNTITIWVFNVLCGIRISDTQTGLRAMSGDVVNVFLDLPGERFEYETNMLIDTKRKSIPIREVPIRTVYLEGNRSSHFNPLLDSIRIYMLILKFLSASVGSCFIDLTVFTIVMAILSASALEWKVTAATIIARIISSLFNYAVNRNFVFQSQKRVTDTIRKYYILAFFQMLLSLGGVYGLTLLLGIHSTAIKAFVDLILFFIGFQIQREWVFNAKRKIEAGESQL